MEPITREEVYMAAASGQAADLPEPITRKEKFLAKAAGMDVKVPEPITREEMYLSRISGGGSSASVPWNDVTFIDYDGTVLYSYSLEAAQALTDLPPLPTQKGLICQGWNLSLEDIKAQNGPVIVGAMYITDDGKTRIYIHLTEGRTSPMLGVCPNGTVTVDWGDGTEPDVLTGTSISTVKWTPTHNYAKAGDYVISLSVDGQMGFYGQDSTYTGSAILRHKSSSDRRNSAYIQAGVKKVEIGDRVTSIGRCAFYDCNRLSSITIPNSVTSIGDSAFYYCYGLTYFIIPNSVTSIGSKVFMFAYCMTSITIPNSVTSIGDNAFYSCSSLSSVAIQNSVTSFNSQEFANCDGMRYFNFSAYTSVPTLGAMNVFGVVTDDCQMLIPSALYEEWSTATNWTSYAKYMVAV